jgi:ClpP class serine protease
MNIASLEHNLENAVWSLPPDRFLALKEKFKTVKNDLAAYTSNGEDDADDQPDEYGRVFFNVTGELLRNTGLPEEVCNFIGITDLNYLDEDLREARDNEDVETIVLYFDSPGGTPSAHSTALLIQEITQTKNVIGYCSGMYCCSAAYNLAAMCDEFYVSATSLIGFVGTIWPRADYTDMNSQLGVKYTFIASSPKKLYLNPDAKATDDEITWIEKTVMYFYNIFKSDVLSNRNISEEFLDASIFIGEQAIETNFADGVINNNEALIKKLNESETVNYL